MLQNKDYSLLSIQSNCSQSIHGSLLNMHVTFDLYWLP